MTKKLVVITGVGKGFGRELVKSLAQDYEVLGISRTLSDLDDLRVDLQTIGLSAHLLCADVANFEDTAELLNLALDKIDQPVYGLINNAGVRCRKKFTDLSINEFIDVANVNLFAAVNLSSVVLPKMLLHKSGRIINVSSILSQSALPELSSYSVSKGGIDAFTRSLAVEFGEDNIAVNSILPGFCKTSYYPKFSQNTELLNMTLQKTPMRRWGEESEVVGLCRFLLSDDASYINGASIPIDGGWLA